MTLKDILQKLHPESTAYRHQRKSLEQEYTERLQVIAAGLTLEEVEGAFLEKFDAYNHFEYNKLAEGKDLTVLLEQGHIIINVKPEKVEVEHAGFVVRSFETTRVYAKGIELVAKVEKKYRVPF